MNFMNTLMIKYQILLIYLMKLKHLSIIIDGIGLQLHVGANFTSSEKYVYAFEKYINTGLEIQITELDIRTEDNEKGQVALCKTIFSTAVKHADQIPDFSFSWSHDGLIG